MDTSIQECFVMEEGSGRDRRENWEGWDKPPEVV